MSGSSAKNGARESAGSGISTNRKERRFERALLELHGATSYARLWRAIAEIIEEVVPHGSMESAISSDAKVPRFTRMINHRNSASASSASGRLGCHPWIDITKCRPGTKLLTLAAKQSETEAAGEAIHMAALYFWRRGELMAQILVCRTIEHGRFTSAEKARLLEWHRHFDVAIRRVGHSAKQEWLISLLGEALEHQSDGLILLDAQRKIVYQNEGAAIFCALWRDGSDAAVVKSNQGACPLPECLVRGAAQLLADYDEARGTSLKLRRFELELSHPGGAAVQARLRVVVPRCRTVQPHLRIDFTRGPESADARLRTPVHRLSGSELRVAHLVAKGMSNHEQP